MLKTIRFKSSLCQDLESRLAQTETEMVQMKAENFKLLKTLANYNDSCSNASIISENSDLNHKTLMANHESLMNKIQELEDTIKDKEVVKRIGTESGYLSQNTEASSTSSANKFKPIKPEEFESLVSSVDLSDILEVAEEESLGEIHPRFCVALHDYYPNSGKSTFGFSAGQLIKVYGIPNEDGMILGNKLYQLLSFSLLMIVFRGSWKCSSPFS